MTHSNIYIDKCSFGRGVFAARNISSGEVILTFTGKLISFDEAVAMGEQESNPMQIDKNLYMDLESPGVIVNHHCHPNAGIVSAKFLVAIVDIKQGEEIFYDYSTTMSENYWTMECQCKASNCRKIIRDFHDLPNEVKQRYLQLGIVHDFIVQEHNLLNRIK